MPVVTHGTILGLVLGLILGLPGLPGASLD